MKRINIMITENQHERLKRLSRSTGLSVSELIRRLVDGVLKLSRNPDK